MKPLKIEELKLKGDFVEVYKTTPPYVGLVQALHLLKRKLKESKKLITYVKRQRREE